MTGNRLIDIGFAMFFTMGLFTGDALFGAVVVPIALIGYHILKLRAMSASIELSFLLLFSVTYPIFWLFSVFLGVDIHYLYWNVNSGLINQAFSSQGLFLASLFAALGNSRPFTVVDYRRKNSAVVFWPTIIAMIVCLFIAARSIQGNIFDQSYDYELSGSSIIFEYVLILILVAYSYSGENVTRRRVLFCAAALFVIAPLYYGKRLPASMVAFAILLLFIRPRNVRQVSVIFGAGFIVLSLLALFRVGETGQSFARIVFNISEDGFMRNNQGGVIYSSAAYMKLVDDGIFDFSFAMNSMANVALSIFMPSSMVDEAAYINFAAMKHIPIPGNGGFPGVTFFVWGGLPGVVLAGAFFGRVMRYSSRYPLFAVYATFLFFTFPRWMAYSVNIMFKAGVLLLITYVIIRLISAASRGPRLTANA